MSDLSTDRPLTRRELRERAQAESAVEAAPAENAVDTAPDLTHDDLQAVVDSAESEPDVQTPDAEEQPQAPRERSVWSYLVTGITAGILLLILGIAALAIVVPAVTGSTALTVMTSSMEPGLPPGTMVVVKPTPLDEIKPGDIITYQLNSGDPALVTHRVTQQLMTADHQLQFITQGDNNPQADPDPVREVQVRGVVWYSIPYLGWVSQVLTGQARSIVIPVVVGALFVYAAWMFFSAMRDRSRQKSAN